MLSADQIFKHHGVKEGDVLNIIAGMFSLSFSSIFLSLSLYLPRFGFSSISNIRLKGEYYEGLCEDDSMMKWDVNRAARVVVRLGISPPLSFLSFSLSLLSFSFSSSSYSISLTTCSPSLTLLQH